jgi:hypothetical protein
MARDGLRSVPVGWRTTTASVAIACMAIVVYGFPRA